MAGAGGGAGRQALHLLAGVLPSQAWVDELGEARLPRQRGAQQRARPVHEAVLHVVCGVDGAAPREQLQQHDAEGEDVGSVRELPAGRVLGRQVAEGAHDARGHVRVGVRRELGQPEVGHHGLEVGVQQDVGGLDVAVDDPRVAVLVEVGEALGGAERDLHAGVPVHDGPVLGIQVVLQRVVGHELVHEHALVAGDAVADERHQVAVVHAADDLHLRLELALPLSAAGLELLHRHLLPAAGEHALVHVPEPALP